MRFEKSNPLVYDRLGNEKEIQQIANFDRFVKMIDAVAVSYCTDFIDYTGDGWVRRAYRVMNLKTGYRSIIAEKKPSFYKDLRFFDHQEYYRTANKEIVYVSHPYADINLLVKDYTVMLNDFLVFMDNLGYTVSFLSPEFDWYNPNRTMAIIIRQKGA